MDVSLVLIVIMAVLFGGEWLLRRRLRGNA